MEEEITKEIIPEKFSKLKDITFQVEGTHQGSTNEWTYIKYTTEQFKDGSDKDPSISQEEKGGKKLLLKSSEVRMTLDFLKTKLDARG